MARKYKDQKSTGRIILLVDDNQEYLEATRLVLIHEGHIVLTASSGKEALKILSESSIDLVLLDFFMPEMTGEQVVTELRKFNQTIQVILQTGYASENPPRELLERLNIQGYYDKSEGTEKFLLWVDVGLKAAYTLSLLNKSRQGLNYILDITPEMHKIQPLDDLLRVILWQFSGLFGFGNSFLAVLPNATEAKRAPSTCESFLAMAKDDTALRIHAGIGKFEGKIILEDVLEVDEIFIIGETLLDGKVKYYQGCTFIPLRVGDTTLGVIYLDENIIQETDLEMLNVFANQAAVAIQNAQLYEMATMDQLTGVNVRRYSIQLLTKELRSAYHSKYPVSLMMLDLDNLKTINDNAGHSAGDQALASLGKVLKKATRPSDTIGRCGGDEFIIVLPNTDTSGVNHVAQRITRLLTEEKIYESGVVHSITGSIGIVTLKPVDTILNNFPHPVPHVFFQAMVQILLKRTDEMLYLAKDNGRNCYHSEEPMEWMDFTGAMDLYEST
jgi:diguanylate cyclase (GGDEF)-like protein